MRKILPLALFAATLVAAHSGASRPRAAEAPMKFSIAKVSDRLGGEPSIATGKSGWMYVSYPGSQGVAFYRSSDAGAHWAAGGLADTASGDDTVAVDASGAIYQGNLTRSLQVDVFKSVDHGGRWTKGKTASSSDSSNQPFLVDRPWTDAWIPPGKTTSDARVYSAYHDFVASQVWVNSSVDGGRTFTNPVNVITSPQAEAATICNSSPAGVKVAPGGPHAGRVYVAWLAADAATSAATGCNVTQMDTFHTIWIAWSDDEGKTWTDHLVDEAGFGHDAAAFWGDLAVDDAGNPYIAASLNLYGEWDVFVWSSLDGGSTWNGSATGRGTPVMANDDHGTHFFPAIAATAPGKVVVAYLASSTAVPVLPYGKPQPGGDSKAEWRVYTSQTTSLRDPYPRWRTAKVTPRPMHVGDVCTLGIFCVPLLSDRTLLDFIDVGVDGAGRTHVAYTDDYDRMCICAGNQVAGRTI